MFTKTLPANEPDRHKRTDRDPSKAPPSVLQSHAHRRTFLLVGIIGLLLVPLLALSAHQVYVSPTCTGLIGSVDYAQVVHLQPQRQSMAVQTANKLDGGAPAMLVQVRTHESQKTLDVSVFGCAIQQGHPQLVQLFSQQGLTQGIAEISQQETLITATLDSNLTKQETAHLLPFQQFLSSEYGWQQGHFTLLRFPGFYPVISRLEAEALQQHANQEQGVPWHDPITTAVQMSRDC